MRRKRVAQVERRKERRKAQLETLWSGQVKLETWPAANDGTKETHLQAAVLLLKI